MCDLLSQTDPYYDFTLIVEEGLSYGIWTQAQGSMHGPSGGRGSPQSSTRTDHAIRRTLYTEVFDEWISENPSRLDVVARYAMATLEYKATHLPTTATFLESWIEFQHVASADERESLIASPTPEAVTRFLKSPETEHHVRNTAFAFFTPTDYPTHDSLLHLLLTAPLREHDPKEVDQMVSLLAPWNRQRLISGHSTISITGRLAHFDLTYVQESNEQLKELAGFLIANYGRQHIITLPRGKRKRVIFEEVARTLDIPGGERLVSEFYAQLSKFSTWIVSILQQYSRLQQSRIRPTVFGNAKQFFFTRMNDRQEIENVARDVGLSDATKDAISRYPLPEHLSDQGKHAALTYYQLDAQQPLCGTIHNWASREMRYCSSSTGKDFDERSRKLRKYPDVIKGILTEAALPSNPSPL